MSETKDRILSTALRLFNENGYTDVSLRAIADELDISVGNLQYHFKKRDDILEALYTQIVDRIDSLVITLDDHPLELLFEGSRRVFAILYDYRFFLLDFVAITRQNKTIKEQYAQLSERRTAQFLRVVHMLISEGVFREEQLKGEYENLYTRIEVIANFWLSSILIQEESLTTRAIDDYSLLLRQSIYPYLTEKGKDAFAKQFPQEVQRT